MAMYTSVSRTQNQPNSAAPRPAITGAMANASPIDVSPWTKNVAAP